MRYILSIFFLVNFFFAKAEKKLVHDTAIVEVRQVNVNAYKSNPVFQYKPIPPKPKTLWDKFWERFWRAVDSVFSTDKGRATFKVSLIVIGVAIIAFFVWKVYGMNRQQLFANNNTRLSYAISEENIHELDFKTAIANAVSKENYKLAIRLLYLQTLKLLSDKELINWQIDKTNTIYVQEMKTHPALQTFTTLTLLFEHTWYGQQAINRQDFEQANNSFIQFQQQV